MLVVDVPFTTKDISQIQMKISLLRPDREYAIIIGLVEILLFASEPSGEKRADTALTT
jgi:hypothetical protein